MVGSGTHGGWRLADQCNPYGILRPHRVEQGCIGREGTSEAAPEAVRPKQLGAITVGYMPLKLARAVDETVAGRWLGALEGAAHRIKPYLGFGVPVGSAYLSARRTFGRPIGRPKVRFNPSPPPCFGRKNGRRYGRTFGRPIGRPKVRPYLRPAGSAGRKSGRTFGRPIGRPEVRPYLWLAELAGRKYGRTSGRPSRPAEGTV